MLDMYPFLSTLSSLLESGERIASQQLQTARDSVQPDHIAHMMFTSVSSDILVLLSSVLWSEGSPAMAY